MHNRHYLSHRVDSIYLPCLSTADSHFFSFFLLSFFCYVSNMCEKNKKTRGEKEKDFFRSWSYDDNDDDENNVADEHCYSITTTRNPAILHVIFVETFSFFFLWLLLLLLKMLNSVAFWSRKKISDRLTLQNKQRHTHYLFPSAL